MCLAELKAGRPYLCMALVKPRPIEGDVQKEQKSRSFSFDASKVNKIFHQLYADKQIKLGDMHKIPLSESIAGKRKMKVDEDPFPKTAIINMVVITLLHEGARDDLSPEGQLLTEEEMRSVQKQDKKSPGVFSHISEPMEGLSG
ncbi:hypothetical protein Droror1_Dr00025288 [Drosera rotundifolia]